MDGVCFKPHYDGLSLESEERKLSMTPDNKHRGYHLRSEEFRWKLAEQIFF
jgi:hypothetical protein